MSAPCSTNSKKRQSGFTLIELLVVIVILATLATVVFVALNPTKRFYDARNARRFGDINSILTAAHQYIVDNDGALPAGINTTEKQLGSCISGGASLCTGADAACLDLSGSTLLGTYLKSIPADPQTGTASTSGYTVVADANNMITVKSCSAEGGTIVQVSR